MIRLGLSRASRLWQDSPQPWRAVHVAGTNGKGSVCQYLSALLYQYGFRTGRFTSPHLVDRWDCIAIDEEPISKSLFQRCHDEVLERDQRLKLGATPFELMTVTAFEVFTDQKVQFGVVETGMGGRDDATNILRHKSMTILTKLALDHQKFLGNTIEEIAVHKSGIFMPNVPVFYDKSNSESVIKVIEQQAAKAGASSVKGAARIPSQSRGFENPKRWGKFLAGLRSNEAARRNIAVAMQAFQHLGARYEVLPSRNVRWDYGYDTVVDTMANLNGRNQLAGIESITDGKGDMALLDGAHNENAAQALAFSLNHRLRLSTHKRYNVENAWPLSEVTREQTLSALDDPIAWVIGCTAGKDVAGILQKLLWPKDRVALVEFGPVDGMPWVEPVASSDLAQIINSTTFKTSRYPDKASEGGPTRYDFGVEDSSLGVAEVQSFGRDIPAALKWAASKTVTFNDDTRNPVVVTGSLYLVADVLRRLRERGAWDLTRPKFRRKRRELPDGLTPERMDAIDEKIAALGKRRARMKAKATGTVVVAEPEDVMPAVVQETRKDGADQVVEKKTRKVGRARIRGRKKGLTEMTFATPKKGSSAGD